MQGSGVLYTHFRRTLLGWLPVKIENQRPFESPVSLHQSTRLCAEDLNLHLIYIYIYIYIVILRSAGLVCLCGYAVIITDWKLFMMSLTKWDVRYMASNDRKSVKSELERMWKQTALLWFEMPYRHLPGYAAGNHENLKSGWPICEQSLIQGTFSFKEMLCTRQWRSIETYCWKTDRTISQSRNYWSC